MSNLLDNYNLTNEDTTGDIKYFGYTKPGGYWIIMRYNSTDGTYDFNLGKDNIENVSDVELDKYDEAWENRAGSGTDYLRAGEIKSL